MPVLKPRETQKVTLKTIPEAEVECYTSFTAGDVEKMTEVKAGTMLVPLTLIIKDWNLEDEAGKKLPINKETVASLDIRDVNHLMSEIQVSLDSFLGETQTANG